MKITITFHENDAARGICGLRNMVEGTCMTRAEAETAEWHKIDGRVVLTYLSSKDYASDVVKMWEFEGFNVYEFHSFTISP